METDNNDTFSTAAKFAQDTTPEPDVDEVVLPADEVEAETGMTYGGAPPTGHDYVTPEDIGEDEAPAYHDGGEPEPVDEPGVAASESAYGEGAYVGSEPPEGFTIKGNERSKKYHLEGSGGYERTIAEVWFNSEDAAKTACFTRALR